MNIYLRLLISFSIGVMFALIGADSSKENYLYTMAIFGYMIAMFIFIPISIYSSKSRSVETDTAGNPIPKLLIASKNRENIGKWITIVALIIFFGFLGTSLVMDAKEAYSFAEKYEDILLGPAVILSPIAVYLFITKQCIYCGVLNGPKDKTCKKCSNRLPAHLLDKYLDDTT